MNLVKLAPDKMRAGSAVEKDRVARILFLNLRINDKNGLSVIWKEPFDSLVKAIEMSFGAREANLLEHLCNIAEWIFEHGKSGLFALPELAPLPLEKLLPEKQYAF